MWWGKSDNTLGALGFVADFQRTLRDGREYEKYFDLSQLQRTDPIEKHGDTFVTVDLMAQLARRYQADTAKLAPVLRGGSLEATCRNIWQFEFSHYQYTEDKAGVEQLRRPLRAWADRKAGIDCDCYAITASTILLNLGIAHKLRKTKYANKSEYQHIYVVVPKPDGSYFTIDPVTDKFNKEVPFTGKFDKTMTPVQVLNGPSMPIQVLNGVGPSAAPLVPMGNYGKFGFGAEFMGLGGETEQVRQQALNTIRQVSLQGLASLASTDVLPSADQVAALASATGQSQDEAAADHLAVAHASASFIERLRQSLINTGEQIDRIPADKRAPELLRLRGRLNLLLTSWTNEAERSKLFAALGEAEEQEYRQQGLAGMGLGNWFGDAWDGIKSAASSVGSAVSQAATWVGDKTGVTQAATWVYGTVIKPVGQAIGQAASWVGNTVAAGAKAAAEGIKNAAKWVGNEAVALGKLLVKYNPLSILIRAGLRIAFRVNLFYMSGRIGHGYFSEAQAKAFGMDMEEWGKCKSQLGKVISMWEGLQGETDVLQESILIGYQSGEQPKIAATPALSGLAGLAGARGLGDPASGTAAVAASGFIATIVAWLKNVDWGKLLNAVTTLAQKLGLKKQYDNVPAINDNTQLPASEQAYLANKALYEQQQPTSSSSSTLPIVAGLGLLGVYLLRSKPS